MKDMQLRGHCQCCGREQAVPRGKMAHHGYTVEHGYFEGACKGHQYRPIEEDRTVADAVCVAVLKDCEQLDGVAADLRVGKIVPTEARTGYQGWNKAAGKIGDVMVPWAEATAQQREREINRRVHEAERRARAGRDFVTFLKAVIEQFHGKPLIKVEREPGPAPIRVGERRVLVRHDGTRYPLKAVEIIRGRVYYRHGDPGRRAWMGTQAWRKLEIEE